jgi:hypothetical protein
MAMPPLPMAALSLFFLVVGALKQAFLAGTRSIMSSEFARYWQEIYGVPIESMSEYLAPEFPVHHRIHGGCVLRRNIRILYFRTVAKQQGQHSALTAFQHREHQLHPNTAVCKTANIGGTEALGQVLPVVLFFIQWLTGSPWYFWSS